MSALFIVALLSAAQIEAAPASRIRAGLVAGEPVGLSLAVPVWDQLAVHLEGGRSARADADLVASLDLVYGFPRAFGPVGDGGVVVWTGLGGRLALGAEEPRPGLRLPFGLSYLSLAGDFELFGYVAPGLSFATRVVQEIGAGFGVRLNPF